MKRFITILLTSLVLYIVILIIVQNSSPGRKTIGTISVITTNRISFKADLKRSYCRIYFDAGQEDLSGVKLDVYVKNRGTAELSGIFHTNLPVSIQGDVVKLLYSGSASEFMRHPYGLTLGVHDPHLHFDLEVCFDKKIHLSRPMAINVIQTGP